MRPRRNLALAIMPLIGPPPTGLIAGLAVLAGKLFSSLAKVLPFLPAAPLIGFLPGILLARWTLGLDVQNFRDPEGFNAHAFKDRQRKVLPRTLLLMVGLLFCFQWFRAAWGPQFYAALVVSLLGIWQLALVRQLAINRNRYFLCSLCACFILWLSFVAELFGEPEFYRKQFCFGLFALLLALGYSYRPMRLDYSLFLRVVQGLIPEVPTHESTSLAQPLSRREILRFARFLSDRFLVGDYRITSTEVWLRLAPVKYAPSMASLMPLYAFWTSHWRSLSHVTIHHDGRVQSYLSPRDDHWLNELSGAMAAQRADLEQRVSGVVAHALSAWRRGDLPEADRYLGEQLEEVIFNMSPAKSKGTRMQKYFLVIVAVVSLLGAVVHVSRYGFGYTPQGFYLKPVATTDAEIRHSLASVTANLELEMHHILALPPPDWFPPPVWAQIHKRMWDDLDRIARLPAGSPTMDLLISSFLSSPFLRNATIQGWITESELVRAGVTPATVCDFLRHLPLKEKAFEFTLREYNARGVNYRVLDPETLAWRLCWLQKVGGLEGIDPQPVFEQIRLNQVIPGNSLARRKPLADRKMWNGLFLMIGSDPLQDTYHCLVILSLLKGMDQIDQRACVEGILRFYHGKGLFGSFRPNDGLNITGDAKDTYYGFESLRILNALSRIKDLPRWAFRPRNTFKPAAEGAPRILTWDEIEAWLLQEKVRSGITAP